MPLWTVNAAFAFFAVIHLAAGIWLLVNFDAVARLFRGVGDMVAAPRRPKATRGRTLLMLAIFSIGLIACMLIWIYLIGGEANEVVDAAA